MHDGWRIVSVDDICETVSVGIVVQPSQYYAEDATGVRAFRSANVGENRVVNSNWVYLSAEGHRLNAKSALREGDVLVVRTGAPGTACVLPASYDGSNCIDIVFARPKRRMVLPDYLAAYTNSDVGRRHVLGNQGGLAQKHLNVSAYKRLPVLLPPIREQNRIVEILRTWDEAIEKLGGLRAANLRRRTWFRTHLMSGRARLTGHNVPWREVRLADVLDEHGQVSTGTEQVYSVSVHKGLVNQIEHLGRSFAAAETGHYNRVLPGDIVYTKSPTGDFPFGIIRQSRVERPVIVSPLYGVFTPMTRALGIILDSLFEAPITVRNYLHPLVQKGAKNTIAITNTRFLQGRMTLPMDPVEQAAIAEIIEASRVELAAIDAEIDALTRQKRGLIQKLLTGEWRVTP
jgi:type I restriction enzyme S subunit